MHENFLNYIMIGLSRGLFSAPSQPSRAFDEEAFLRRQAAALRQAERERAVHRQAQAVPQQPARDGSGQDHDEEEPAAIWRRGARLTHMPCSRPCRAA
jgi:hypothetical protein